MKLPSVPRAAVLAVFLALAGGTFAIIGCKNDQAKVELASLIKETREAHKELAIKIQFEKLDEELTKLQNEGAKGGSDLAAANKLAKEYYAEIVVLKEAVAKAGNDVNQLKIAAAASEQRFKEKIPEIKITVNPGTDPPIPSETTDNLPPDGSNSSTPSPVGTAPPVPDGTEVGGDDGKKTAMLMAAAAAVAAGTPVGVVAIALAAALGIDIDLGLLTKSGNPIQYVIEQGIKNGKLPKDFKWPEGLGPNPTSQQIKDAINQGIEKLPDEVRKKAEAAKEKAETDLKQLATGVGKNFNDLGKGLAEMREKPAQERQDYVINATKAMILKGNGKPEGWINAVLEYVQSAEFGFSKQDMDGLKSELKKLNSSTESK